MPSLNLPPLRHRGRRRYPQGRAHSRRARRYRRSARLVRPSRHGRGLRRAAFVGARARTGRRLRRRGHRELRQWARPLPSAVRARGSTRSRGPPGEASGGPLARRISSTLSTPHARSSQATRRRCRRRPTGASRCSASIKVARDTAVKARTQAMIALKSVLVTASDELRAEMEGQSDFRLIHGLRWSWRAIRRRSSASAVTTTLLRSLAHTLARAPPGDQRTHARHLQADHQRDGAAAHGRVRDRVRLCRRDADRRPATTASGSAARPRSPSSMRCLPDPRLVGSDHGPTPTQPRGQPAGQRSPVPNRDCAAALAPADDRVRGSADRRRVVRRKRSSGASSATSRVRSSACSRGRRRPSPRISRRGLDNYRSINADGPAAARCESFFATLECELLDRRRFATKAEARMAVFRFIEGWSGRVPARTAVGATRRSATHRPPRTSRITTRRLSPPTPKLSVEAGSHQPSGPCFS